MGSGVFGVTNINNIALVAAFFWVAPRGYPPQDRTHPLSHSQAQRGLRSIFTSQRLSHRMLAASQICYRADPVWIRWGRTSHLQRSLPSVDLYQDIRLGEKGSVNVASGSTECLLGFKRKRVLAFLSGPLFIL